MAGAASAADFAARCEAGELAPSGAEGGRRGKTTSFEADPPGAAHTRPQEALDGPAQTPRLRAEATRTPPLRLKLTAPEPSERDIHVACADLLNMCLAPPAVWAPYPAGVTALTPQQHAQYSRIGIQRGFPDLMIFYKKVFGIELKARRGRLSKTRVARTRRGGPRMLIGQEEMFDLLLASGAWAAIEVARSVDEVCLLLDIWKIPKRGGDGWLRGLSGQQHAAILGERAVDVGGASG